MTTASVGADPRDMAISAKGDKLRLDLTTTAGAKTHAVYTATTNDMVLFLDSQRQYVTLDFKGPSAAPNTSAATSTITKAGGHKTVAGYNCEEWSVKDANGHHSEVCIAQGLAYFDPSHLRPGAAQQPETALAMEFREKKSFPLESIEFDADGKEVSRMEVVKIEPAPIPDGDFTIPQGYTKVELPPSRR